MQIKSGLKMRANVTYHFPEFKIYWNEFCKPSESQIKSVIAENALPSMIKKKGHFSVARTFMII
jgi:hypothetical protein